MKRERNEIKLWWIMSMFSLYFISLSSGAVFSSNRVARFLIRFVIFQTGKFTISKYPSTHFADGE